MDKRILAFGICLVVAVIAVGLTATAFAAPRGAKACRDGVDNDGDGYTDYPADPGCSNKNDNSELDPNVECDDGNDNDGDSAIDYNDAGCSGPTDDDETNCGDDVCEGGEDCDNCAADCLPVNYVCCDGIPYYGDCCDDNDCTSPEICYYHSCMMPDSCSDTDGGFVTDTQGTVSGYYYGNPYEFDDVCNSTTLLVEYYCIGDDFFSDGYDCSMNFTSCSNGACV